MTATDPFAIRRLCRPRGRSRAAFTLTELLVVVAIIVLLVSMLLTALNQVQAQAKKTATLATMQAFANACDAFQQEHGRYPGVVPEVWIANNNVVSGTENAILELMGGFVREDDVGTIPFESVYTCAEGWKPVPAFKHPMPGEPDYRIKVNLNLIGDGPIMHGTPFATYFTPGEKEFAITTGQPTIPNQCPGGSGGDQWGLPDLLDGWGQPIIYLRQQRSKGPLTAIGGSPPQFVGGSMRAYIESSQLGRLGGNQLADSIFNTAPDPLNTLALILGHPELSGLDQASGNILGQARGAFMLLSAGPDGVYFSRHDGPGEPGDGNEVDNIIPFGPSIIEEFDDVLIFGGG